MNSEVSRVDEIRDIWDSSFAGGVARRYRLNIMPR